MKLTATELATIIGALDREVYETGKLANDKSAPEIVKIAERRLLQLETVRAKLKTELRYQVKKITTCK